MKCYVSYVHPLPSVSLYFESAVFGLPIYMSSLPCLSALGQYSGIWLVFVRMVSVPCGLSFSGRGAYWWTAGVSEQYACIHVCRAEANQTCARQNSSNLLCDLTAHRIVRKNEVHPQCLWLCMLHCLLCSSYVPFNCLFSCRNLFWPGWCCFVSVCGSICAILLHLFKCSKGSPQPNVWGYPEGTHQVLWHQSNRLEGGLYI